MQLNLFDCGKLAAIYNMRPGVYLEHSQTSKVELIGKTVFNRICFKEPALNQIKCPGPFRVR